MSTLTKDEILRYQRHLTLPQFGQAAQLKLKQAAVLVIGAGGLGCPVLQYLAAAGVGKLGIVDDDVVSLSNLQRQILFSEADVGLGKAQVAQRKLRAINPHVACEAYPVRFGVENAMQLLDAYDVIVDGTDNFPTRYLINDACVRADKPFIYGALYTFQGQASVFNYQAGPTYRCLFPEPPRAEDAPNCAEIGVVGVLPGLIGLIQATEAIKVITGVGEVLSGKLLTLDALTMRQQLVHFRRVAEQAQTRALAWIDYSCQSRRAPAVQELAPAQLHADPHAYQLLDVREDWERAICSLPGAHLPLADLLAGNADFAAMGIDPAKPTCVYCKAGSRSRQAAEALQANHAFQQVRSLRGGILEWAAELDPAMQTY